MATHSLDRTQVLEVRNPATGDRAGTYTIIDAPAVHDAVASARAALDDWRARSPADRGEYLLRIADTLEERAPQIGALITQEMGRPHAESVPEVAKSAAFFRYFAGLASSVLSPTPIDLAGLATPDKRAWIRHEPRGVVAIIKPWNAPVQQIVWAAAPALAAGCVVLIKPSEFTPGSALALQEAADAAGLPPGVLTTLVGGPEIGAALVEADVDMIAFTGSVASGRDVAAVAGRRLKKCLLELSGKDSLIVDAAVENVDLVAAGIVYGAFSNCGHWCSSIERVLLPASRYDEILDAVLVRVEALRVGPGEQPGIDVGPVANEKQYDIVREVVLDALDRGAQAPAGGAPLENLGDGFFFAPTVLTHVPTEARLESENVFGPVVAVEPYVDVDVAIARANSTNYGLGLSVWTDDPRFAEYVTARSDTGMVWVNEPLQSLAPCPWSVTKDSGIGSELGSSGLLEFTYEKVVQSQLEGNDEPRRPWYFPYA